eukprot:Mycagemm_TRINITY_DN10298_c1_g2::TRINITY_DN10298_c1_g2_i1::g.4215::m.4215 type:complete len:114 gc:universal TRINITY_DN10298_c1_g2_i1:451-792(+)
MLMRKTRTSVSVLNERMAASRAACVMLPSRRTKGTDVALRRSSTRSSMVVHCENTMVFTEASSARRAASSSMSASILVDERDSCSALSRSSTEAEPSCCRSGSCTNSVAVIAL